ncbi:MAG: chemotaxis protein [Sulfurospirillaceae bacterium]|nr:chemotaxis protein [Sulfurospirillaceae bacterium]
MTQEELDALMAGDLDDLDSDISDEEAEINKTEEVYTSNDTADQDKKTNDGSEESYKMDANKSWPPPPPTEEHKMVTQLDDVTRDSEIKATQIFDKLESMSNVLMDMHSDFSGVSSILDSNIALFERMVEKFPNISQFEDSLSNNKDAKGKIKTLISSAQSAEDEVMMVMDIMQYQDIHRQKIERVINVMRALSKYISLLFEGSIDDNKRVGSAVHIAGDESTDDLVTSEDIEAIIESLGKKK